MQKARIPEARPLRAFAQTREKGRRPAGSIWNGGSFWQKIAEKTMPPRSTDRSGPADVQSGAATTGSGPDAAGHQAARSPGRVEPQGSAGVPMWLTWAYRALRTVPYRRLPEKVERFCRKISRVPRVPVFAVLRFRLVTRLRRVPPVRVPCSGGACPWPCAAAPSRACRIGAA